MSDQGNLTRIKVVNDALEELSKEVVYVGGATVAMYKDRPASEARVTDDVDIVVELATYSACADIEEKLRKKGFENEVNSKIICRYTVKGIVVDVMPTDENVLGFKNQWYSEGFKNAIEYAISETETVKIFNSVYFLASKLDAFRDRGNDDGRLSSDFEDIIYILNNRTTIWAEMQNASYPVKTYLKKEFSLLIEQDYFDEWISAHLDYSEQRRVNFIMESLRDFTCRS